MSERGVFAVHRGVFDHPMFAPEPFTEREAWLWMISAAVWKATKVRAGRKLFDLGRGQLVFSERFLAEKWKWAKTRVRRFLERLKTEAMIGTLADRDATLITICNYERYAFDGTTRGPQAGPQDGPLPDHSRTKEEELKKVITDSEANASGAEAPIDHRKRLFNEGLSKLGIMTGKGPDACRSFVGKCLKAASDDAIVVLGLIEDAERNRVVDPSAWIVARLKPSTGPPERPLTEFQRGRHELKGILNDLGNFARGSCQSDGTDPRLLSRDTSERSEGVRGGPRENIIELPPGSYRSSG